MDNATKATDVTPAAPAPATCPTCGQPAQIQQTVDALAQTIGIHKMVIDTLTAKKAELEQSITSDPKKVIWIKRLWWAVKTYLTIRYGAKP